MEDFSSHLYYINWGVGSALLNFEIEIEIKLWKRRFVLEFPKRVMEGIWMGAVSSFCIKTISLVCLLANLLVGLLVCL